MMAPKDQQIAVICENVGNSSKLTHADALKLIRRILEASVADSILKSSC